MARVACQRVVYRLIQLWDDLGAEAHSSAACSSIEPARPRARSSPSMSRSTVCWTDSWEPMAISFIGIKIFRIFYRDAHADATICCLPASGQQILTVVTSATVWFRKNWFRRCASPWNGTRSWCGAASFVVIGATLRLFSCVKRTNGGGGAMLYGSVKG